MTRKLTVLFFIVLGTMFAQQTKSGNNQPAYTCVGPLPVFADESNHPPSIAAEKAAETDCKARRDQERAQETAQRDKDNKKLSALRSKTQQVIEPVCKDRVQTDDGLDNVCKNIPPDLENLREQYRRCRDAAELSALANDKRSIASCNNLIPLSQAKLYPKPASK